jgi:energy-coupling factor transport system ATP-binding protein
LISIREVTYTYVPTASEPALRAVSVTIGGGEMVAVLGANGSGKSTLARLMNGLLLPQHGEVEVDGQSTRDATALREIRRRVGMVFQNPENQIVSSSVAHDVAFGLENLCVSPAVMVARVAEALAVVGLGGREDDDPQDLSASEKQRLAIAGVLAVEPAYLVLDEATAYLDGADRQDVLDTVVRLRAGRAISVVLITHLMEEALLADRVLVMALGSIVYEGTPAELFALPPQQLATWRLSVPALVRLTAGLREGGLAVPGTLATPIELVRHLCSSR